LVRVGRASQNSARRSKASLRGAIGVPAIGVSKRVEALRSIRYVVAVAVRRKVPWRVGDTSRVRGRVTVVLIS
jgi:hypothetical protein